MLIEIVFRDVETSVVVDVERFYNEIERALPFESEAKVWKQEVYFSTPIDIVSEDVTSRVEKGRVYYWKPGKALCLFYGLSQVYTPATYIGTLLDPVNRLYGIKDGYRVEVRKHVIHEEFAEIVKILEGLGYKVATPLDGGMRIVVANRYIRSTRVALSIYVEEYGLHIESEAFARHTEDLASLSMVSKLKNVIERSTDLARLDTTEDGRLCVTAAISNVEELPRAIRDVEKAMMYIALQYGNG